MRVRKFSYKIKKKSKQKIKKQFAGSIEFPNMLLCVIGGLTYNTEIKAFKDSALGKTYINAIDDPNCHICIIDPAEKYKESTLFEIMIDLLHICTNIPNPILKKRIKYYKEDAVEFNFNKLLHKEKWRTGGICFALDIVGKETSKFNEIRGNIWKKLSRAITSKDSVPATVFWNNAGNEIERVRPRQRYGSGWLLEYKPLLEYNPDFDNIEQFHHLSLRSIGRGVWFITNPKPIQYDTIVTEHRDIMSLFYYTLLHQKLSNSVTTNQKLSNSVININ